jgi:hypothetical protein
MPAETDFTATLRKVYQNYTAPELERELALWRECKGDVLKTGQRVNNFGLSLDRVDVTLALEAEAVILQIIADRADGIRAPIRAGYAYVAG